MKHSVFLLALALAACDSTSDLADACVPHCDDRVCGHDGCGGECSPGCNPGEICDSFGRCQAEGSCGGSGEDCCNGTACNSGLDCIGGICQGATYCGASGQPCCSGSTCNTGLSCVGGVCQATTSCGSSGQPCCAGSACSTGLSCVGGYCQGAPYCGSSGQPCCAGSACNTGLSCVGGVCQATTSCGASEQPCCVGMTCNTDLGCVAGYCRPCGNAGQLCCEGASCVGLGTTCRNGFCTCDEDAHVTYACELGDVLWFDCRGSRVEIKESCGERGCQGDVCCSCGGRECGMSTCGGNCGSCNAPYVRSDQGQCVDSPNLMTWALDGTVLAQGTSILAQYGVSSDFAAIQMPYLAPNLRFGVSGASAGGTLTINCQDLPGAILRFDTHDNGWSTFAASLPLAWQSLYFQGCGIAASGDEVTRWSLEATYSSSRVSGQFEIVIQGAGIRAGQTLRAWGTFDTPLEPT